MAMAATAGVALERSAESTGIAAQPSVSEAQADDRWKPVLGLSCELTVELPMPGFKIADLVDLRKGSIIDAHWPVGHDVPLCLNATRIAWIEFEVVGGNLAVRLTELA
jgi:flagellar motor switch/type III secretory pathway protein FliN